MRPSPIAIALLVISPWLAGCASLAPAGDIAGTTGAADAPAAPAGAAAHDVPADDNLNAVLWVQRSVEYRAVSESIYRAAAEELDAALADPQWNALVPGERGGDDATLPPAVVMDVDETVLDNSPYQARLVRDGLEYDDATWAAWVEERKARPVPGVVEFARAADAKGVTILYVSNREQRLADATLANLRSVGLPVSGDDAFLGLGTVVEGCAQAGSGKTCRRQLAGRSYRVLMQFGDQLGDFAETAGTTTAREALHDEYRSWFGERWWVLPNPTYGAWEPALWSGQRGLSRESKREAKRSAMRFDQ